VAEIEEAEQEGVKFQFRAWPDRVVTEGGRVRGMVFSATECGAWDAQGRRGFDRCEGTAFEVPTDVVLICIGQSPDASFGGASDLQTGRGGRLTVDANSLVTSRPGMFGGGDVVTGPGYVIDAIAAGRRAAVAMDKYVRGDDSRVVFPPSWRVIGDPTPPSPDQIAQDPRAAVASRPVGDRVRTFDEVELGLTPEQTAIEGRRCLRCDLESLAARTQED
jgi:NADH-quinone oxidoreductase subunit F